LATTVVSPLVSATAQPRSLWTDRSYSAWLVTGLTFLAIATHGYHPYAEDGGLYLAGVKHLLDPSLYPQETAFVVEHLRFSVFAPVVAILVRGSGLAVDTVMFLLYAATIWLTLFAAWTLVGFCYQDRIARTAAVALLATWLTLPIAGTSLMLMDPYLTARSISTPCGLLALSGMVWALLQESGHRRMRRLLLPGCALLVGAVFHPLMTAYALACVVVLGALHASRSLWIWTLAAVSPAAVAMAAILQALSAPESANYVHVAMTRTYWFLSQWHWYEWVGLAAPLALLATMARCWRNAHPARLALARMSLAVGTAAVAVSLMFAHVNSATHLVARLQPLRSFQLIYVVMILFVGAELGRRVLRREAARWCATFAVLVALMVTAERRFFPASPHITFAHLPVGSVEENPWVRAFLWVRDRTPKGALVALDANYIETPGEDAQCFRAIAERSALPDYSKDGGEASITPALAEDWVAGVTAQTGLSTETDDARISALKPLGVDWLVLERKAFTGFDCVYANEAVKVCRMPWTLVSSRSPASPRR